MSERVDGGSAMPDTWLRSVLETVPTLTCVAGAGA
jgi:hypothetical protein